METVSKLEYVKKRNGEKVKFNEDKIKAAITKAFLSKNISDEKLFAKLTDEVVEKLEGLPTIEQIQDIVEETLILNKYADVAKAYILYRKQHKDVREEKTLEEIKDHSLMVMNKGKPEPFDPDILYKKLEKTAKGLKRVSVKEIIDEVSRTVYNGITVEEVHDALVNAVKTHIEKHYDYSALASRLLLDQIYHSILHRSLYSEDLGNTYQEEFENYIEKGVDLNFLNPKLKEFDLKKIARALDARRDLDFFFLGMQTIYDRYLLRERSKERPVFELPQYMWMRVAMGMAINEKQKEERAIEFYDALSQFYVVSSTPTLFNSGTTRSQMSSCFLNIVDDSIHGIFKNYSDNAKLCKWAGAVGTDWTPVRSKGATIKGTNGQSQGIIPFIKIFNDVALAVNQGGKRKGALAAYLEVWHRDVEEFLELRKNTGDERRRAHDIHTAAWIPDLFMKRVKEKAEWTLFSPETVPGLHDLYGKEFEDKYKEYEKQDLPGSKKIKAADLWRKMLTMLFETGHPWITFKDPSNIRSPQDHAGVVHASNLCTEITLNTSEEETAVCNLASVNLSKLIKDNDIDEQLLEKTVTTGVRMLNNVIDVNFYTIPETKNSNMKHRPVGLGMMGYHDALFKLGIDFDSKENLDFADKSMEMISYYAILASSKLAKEFIPYPSYKGSKWDRGIFPIDTLEILEKQRGMPIKVPRTSRMDWSKVKQHVKEHGMMNSNVMAIAPTATIANISGVIPCVEPIFKNIYMKENMSGNFIVINRHLIDELDKAGLWNENILTKIKMHNGSILNIDEIPADIRRRFKEVFEIDPVWIIQAAALRSKWIDQSASTNLFVKTTSGKVISDIYMLAWETGLKTTYYLRTLAASQVTKTIPEEVVKKDQPKVCQILDPDCESCQ